jgi:Carboxypeptidase regulatory-like domain
MFFCKPKKNPCKSICLMLRSFHLFKNVKGSGVVLQTYLYFYIWLFFVEDSEEILKNEMDNLIVNFHATTPDFVKKYESTRILIDPSTTRQLKDKVTNKSDASALHNAEITIVEQTKTAKTNSLGNYSIKPAPIGKFTIRVHLAGFTDVEIFDFDIKLGEITTLNVELVSN